MPPFSGRWPLWLPTPFRVPATTSLPAVIHSCLSHATWGTCLPFSSLACSRAVTSSHIEHCLGFQKNRPLKGMSRERGM